jgi:ABC-type amino acid transport substrate-binding protein
MASSVVAICNRACDYLGAAPVTSLEDGSKLSGLLLRNYELARDTILRSYPWNCATARASLAALTTAPAWGYAFQYQLPVDCLRVVEMDGYLDQGIAWRVEGLRLLTDAGGPVRIRYIQRVDDPAQFDPALADAIAARLAADIAYAVTGNASQAQALTQLAEARLLAARRVDAIEQSQDDRMRAEDWMDARF